MSWSVTAIGSPAGVAAKFGGDLRRNAETFNEPERSLCMKIADLVDLTLAEFPPGVAVDVSGNGYQSTTDGGAVNTVHLKITPIYGFIP